MASCLYLPMTSAKGSLGVDRLRGRGHEIRYAPETMESAFFQSTIGLLYAESDNGAVMAVTQGERQPAAIIHRFAMTSA